MYEPSSLYKRHRFPGEDIRHAVWLYSRFLLRYRDVEELLAGMFLAHIRWEEDFPVLEKPGRRGVNATSGSCSNWTINVARPERAKVPAAGAAGGAPLHESPLGDLLGRVCNRYERWAATALQALMYSSKPIESPTFSSK